MGRKWMLYKFYIEYWKSTFQKYIGMINLLKTMKNLPLQIKILPNIFFKKDTEVLTHDKAYDTHGKLIVCSDTVNYHVLWF